MSVLLWALLLFIALAVFGALLVLAWLFFVFVLVCAVDAAKSALRHEVVS